MRPMSVETDRTSESDRTNGESLVYVRIGRSIRVYTFFFTPFVTVSMADVDTKIRRKGVFTYNVDGSEKTAFFFSVFFLYEIQRCIKSVQLVWSEYGLWRIRRLANDLGVFEIFF